MTAPTYDIDFADLTVDPVSKKSFKIAPGELNTTNTSLHLPGAGYAPYGEPIVESLVRLLESFASATAPVTPTIGQLWYDTGTKLLKVLASITTTGTTINYNWENVSNNTTISVTEPTDRTRLWYDTSAPVPANHQLKIFNTFSGIWQPVLPGGLQVSTTAPSSTSALWYNTSNSDVTRQEVYVYNPTTSGWQPAASHAAELLTGTVPNARLTTSSIGGNAATATLAANATKLATGRTITLATGAAGSVVFDGSANVTLNVTSLNASVLSSGTVPIDRLGSAGTRAAGYYLNGANVWTQIPTVVDAYTKVQTDALVGQRVLRDSITYAGFASNNVTLPYFRRESDNTVYYLQPRLGYTPAPVATTLAGYGITNAYTKAEVNALIPSVPPITGSLGTTGWTRLSNGLTLQWGVGPALGDDSAATVSLAVTATILNVQVTGFGVYASGTGPSWLTDSWSTTSFRVSNNYNSGPNRPFRWFAITIT